MKEILTTIAVATLIVLQAHDALAADPLPQDPAAQATPPPPAPQPGEKTAAAQPFREPGRFGLVGAITDDGFQFGFTRVGEHYEAIVTMDASYASFKSSSALTGNTGDIGVTVRGGPRFQIGHLNYLGFGAQFSPSLFGQDNGVSTMGSFTTGPYVSASRDFAGTPLMITLWVLPYQFVHDLGNDGSGKQVAFNNHEFFQGGGFGLSYLF